METGTMPSIMANVEGLVAMRSRRQLALHRTWIGHIVTGRKQDVFLYLVVGWLCTNRSE